MENTIPMISIIVPVYNAESYLRRCIDSILAQTFVNFECILVDDGSPDNCPAICDEYAIMDNRIKVIHQENTGAAHARNVGVKISIGEFLVFVDSDDTIPPNAIHSLYEKQCESSAEIVCGAVKFSYEKKEKIVVAEHIFLKPLDYILSPSVCCGLWGKMYRRKLFYNDLYIPCLNFGEDLIVNVQLFFQVKQEKMVFLNTIVYIYDNTTIGITRRTKMFKHLSWQEYPPISCHLWIYDWLMKNKLFNDGLKEIFLCRMLKYGIVPYICDKGKVNRDEIGIFYNDYFVPCTLKNEIIYIKKIIIPLYRISSAIGFLYVSILNVMINIRSKRR